MNLVFVSCGLKDHEAWRLALGVNKVIHIDTKDILLGLRDASIELDEYIYLENNKVDFVLFCNNEAGIKWGEFLTIKDYIEETSDTVYFTQLKRLTDPYERDIINLEGNFYCRPHVFTMMGSLYKLNMDNTNVKRESRGTPLETRILYGLIKGGYGVKLI